MKKGKNSGQTLDLGITQTCGRLLPENTDFTDNIVSKETDETAQPSVILAKCQTEIRVFAARLNPTQNTRIQSLTQYHKRLSLSLGGLGIASFNWNCCPELAPESSK